MIFEQGPRGKIHSPRYRDGCYRGRVADCCLLCLGRMLLSSATAPVKYRLRNARTDENHRLVEESVVVPYIDPSSDTESIDYKPGKIEEVHCFSGTEPALVTVRTDDDEHIYINLTVDEAEQVVEA